MRAQLSDKHPCVYPHAPFLLLINTLIVSLLSFSMWKFISAQLTGLVMTTGPWRPGFSALTAAGGFKSLARNQKPCFQPLQAQATRDHYHPLLTPRLFFCYVTLSSSGVHGPGKDCFGQRFQKLEMERSKEIKMCCQRKGLPTLGQNRGKNSNDFKHKIILLDNFIHFSPSPTLSSLSKLTFLFPSGSL